MVEKCFFDRRMNCVVQERMLKNKDLKAIISQRMDMPKMEWCVPCLLDRILKEIKEDGD